MKISSVKFVCIILLLSLILRIRSVQAEDKDNGMSPLDAKPPRYAVIKGHVIDLYSLQIGSQSRE